MVEAANRFRLDPGGEFDRLIAQAATRRGRDDDVTDAIRFHRVDMDKLRAELSALSPAAPLVWSEPLHAAARGHSALMRVQQTQSHQLPGEPPLGDRIKAQGYDYRIAAENVFAWTVSALHGHAAFVIDWGPGTADGMQAGRGHRMVLTDPRLTEIGVSALPTDGLSWVGPHVVTQNLGARFDAGPFLTGTIWRDRDGDGIYDPGEGRGGARVAVEGRGVDRSGAAGDWGLEVGEGAATLRLSGTGVDGVIRLRLDVGRENAKLDVIDRADLATSADLTLLSPVRSVTVLGTQGLTLAGSAAADRLIGGPGADHLIGGGGADRIWGGPGPDRIEGGAGPDRLWGGPGADRIWGGAGNDRLWGGGGPDRLWGGAGDDLLFGGAGDDVLRGGAGDDVLRGGPGDDRLFGGRGDDVLRGGPGEDRLFGGPGRDVFVFGPRDDRNRILDWEGIDRLAFVGGRLDPSDLRVNVQGDHARLRWGDTVVIVEGAAEALAPRHFLWDLEI